MLETFFSVWPEIASSLAQWQVWLYVMLGVACGVAVGSIPGMTGSMAIALLLPVTYHMSPVEALVLLIGIYKGSMFGGSISAVCFGAPGTPAASADVLDGYPLTKQGKAKKALQMALYASTTGDFLSDVVLIVVIGPLAVLALLFGPRELFALMILALITIIIFVQQAPLKGLIGASIGFLLASIGPDPMGAIPRLSFGIRALRDGIHLIPFVIGLFAFSELYSQVVIFLKETLLRLLNKAKEYQPSHTGSWKITMGREGLTFKEYISCYREILTGWVIGTFLGALPGPGSSLAAFTSYAMAKKFSANKENFGQGALEGLAAAEAGNSATSGATFIPLFAFGIPGSALAGLFLAAFLLQGITPGPVMFREEPVVLFTILVVLLMANFFHLLIGRLLIPLFTKVAGAPRNILLPFITVLASLGIYALEFNTNHVIFALLVGLLGYILRQFGYSLVPPLIAFMIAPMLERHLRTALIIARGDVLYLFRSRIAIILYVLSLLIVLSFFFLEKMKKKKEREVGGEEGARSF